MSAGLTVVVPAWNEEGRLTATVEAVVAAAARRLAAFEVIVVDDGSTDDTRQRLARYGDRIRYVYQENQGLSAARNAGIRAARGDYVGLLDSDDLWHPRKLEVQTEFLVRHPEVGLLAADCLMDFPREWPDVDPARPPGAQAVTLNELVVRSRFGPGGVLVRGDCFRAVGLFDTGLRSAEDRDMWIRIARRFPVVKLRAALWYYRVHDCNMHRAAVRMEENEMKMLAKALADEASRPPLPVRLKALSHAAYSAAYRYGAADMPARSLFRMLRSFALWPLPFPRADMRTGLARPKRLAWALTRVARALRPKRRVAAAAALGAPASVAAGV